jgi:hypothetical protein
MQKQQRGLMAQHVDALNAQLKQLSKARIFLPLALVMRVDYSISCIFAILFTDGAMAVSNTNCRVIRCACPQMLLLCPPLAA